MLLVRWRTSTSYRIVGVRYLITSINTFYEFLHPSGDSAWQQDHGAIQHKPWGARELSPEAPLLARLVDLVDGASCSSRPCSSLKKTPVFFQPYCGTGNTPLIKLSAVAMWRL